MQKSYPLRLKNDLLTFLNSCTLRTNYPFALKYAFKPDGTLVGDLSEVDSECNVLILSKYPVLVRTKEQEK